MNYDHFTRLSSGDIPSPLKRLSSDSEDNVTVKEWTLNADQINASSGVISNRNQRNCEMIKTINIFENTVDQNIRKICFKKDNKKIEDEFEQNLLRNGFGVQIFKDGSKFKGMFKNNIVNGKGELLYNNGTKVVGKWKDNVLTSGTIHYESGTSFKGEFQKLNDPKNKISGECFKKGIFEFTDKKYFDGVWNSHGSLIKGFLYEGKKKCFRVNINKLPLVIHSIHRGMGIIVNKRWIYEGQIKNGRMSGKGWIYEPLNCSYIRTDWDLNSLGRDFEFRYINENVFFKKEFESSGGKLRKVRVFLPTGIVFETDFAKFKRDSNIGILRLQFEDLKGVFKGKVDRPENIRGFDGNYIHNKLNIPVKILFDNQKQLIFLSNGKLMNVDEFKNFVDIKGSDDKIEIKLNNQKIEEINNKEENKKVELQNEKNVDLIKNEKNDENNKEEDFQQVDLENTENKENNIKKNENQIESDIENLKIKDAISISMNSISNISDNNEKSLTDDNQINDKELLDIFQKNNKNEEKLMPLSDSDTLEEGKISSRNDLDISNISAIETNKEENSRNNESKNVIFINSNNITKDFLEPEFEENENFSDSVEFYLDVQTDSEFVSMRQKMEEGEESESDNNFILEDNLTEKNENNNEEDVQEMESFDDDINSKSNIIENKENKENYNENKENLDDDEENDWMEL